MALIYMAHSNLNGVFIPPLNRVAHHILLPSSDHDHWINDHFEERIRDNYDRLVERGILPPWYYPIIEIFTGIGWEARKMMDCLDKEPKGLENFEERIQKKSKY
jgi:hypothetical protein